MAVAATLAVAAHAAVLLGVALPEPGAGDDRRLNIALVSEASHEPIPADTLAAADQHGQHARTQRARSRANPEGDAGRADAQPTDAPGRGGSERAPLLARDGADATRTRREGRPGAAGEPDATERNGAEHARRRAAQADPRAAYLDAWRQTIERIGTQQFPAVSTAQASLTMEVVLDADGELVDAEVVDSSGHPAVDAAALRILRQATPFAPFPDELAAKAQRLRFAYEWRFLAGGSTETARSP